MGIARMSVIVLSDELASRWIRISHLPRKLPICHSPESVPSPSKWPTYRTEWRPRYCFLMTTAPVARSTEPVNVNAATMSVPVPAIRPLTNVRLNWFISCRPCPCCSHHPSQTTFEISLIRLLSKNQKMPPQVRGTSNGFAIALSKSETKAARPYMHRELPVVVVCLLDAPAHGAGILSE